MHFRKDVGQVENALPGAERLQGGAQQLQRASEIPGGGLGYWVEHQCLGGKEVIRCRNADQTQKLEDLGLKMIIDR